MKQILILMAVLFSVGLSAQQMDKSKLKGYITDQLTEEPIPFCNYYLYQDFVYTGKGGYSDSTGMFVLDNIEPGSYEVGFSDVSHPEKRIKVELSSGKITMLNPVLSLNETDLLDIYVFPDLFNPDAPTETLIKSKEITKLPVASGDINGLAAAMNSNVQEDERTGSLYVRGSRDGNTMYVIDGIKATGPISVPNSAIAEMRVITSGIPAEFGDVTGGIIYITTKKYTGRR